MGGARTLASNLAKRSFRSVSCLFGGGGSSLIHLDLISAPSSGIWHIAVPASTRHVLAYSRGRDYPYGLQL